MSDCPHIKRIAEYDGDTEDRCGLVPRLFCWGPGATQCPLKGEKMSELKPCPREAEALEIIETMLDIADMKCTGPLYADDPPRSGLCRIPEEDAAILRQYIADRRAQPANLHFSDCHIWEPGDKLDTLSDKCDVLIKASDIRALIAQPSNEPLTLEQLRGMIGQWVWVIVKYEHCECSGWALIAPNCLGYLDQTIPFAFYMKKAIAYRRPPERSENDG